MRYSSAPDYVLFLIVLVLVVFGSVMIYSSSAFVADSGFKTSVYFLKKQLVWIALSFVLLFVFKSIDYHKLRYLATPALVLSLFLLVVVLFFEPTKGVKRWIRLGGFGFQPSELFKYCLLLFISASLVKKSEKIKKLKYILIPYFLILGIAFLLIFKQPHLGAIFAIGTSSVLLLFVGGARLRHLLILILPVFLLGVVLVFGLGYEKDRVRDYMNSFKNPLEGSYQLQQSVIGLGSGGLYGKGLGNGKQKLFFLPEPHTDFIFSAIGEEGGFIFTCGIMLLFLIFGLRGIKICLSAPDRFGFLLAFGMTSILISGALINTGVVLGLLPTTGIPCPFLSYGGSSLVMAMCGVGILLNISQQKALKKRKSYSKPYRWKRK
ncbi:MAG: hypothetical protein AMJ90_02070 [candidate division Zixibacteria bacterium SM23_73_2]|nr:MAG: hypothetical protein AMJ90_02070 [candidate division Zixibacteria bacterium SM23_73_2]